MSLILPEPITRYFSADATSGSDSVAQCFTDDCIVKDEGNTYRGKDAVRKWKEDASSKYEYTSEVISVDKRIEETIVVCHLEGNFPGSPIDLRYAFILDTDKIKFLEITL